MKIKHKKFIADYEKIVKEKRDEYYKNLVINNKSINDGINVGFLYIVSFIVGILVLFVGDFLFVSYIVSIILMIVVDLLIKFLSKALKLESNNKYLMTIKSLGYFSIEDYEKKLRHYVIGKGGYYEYLLNELIKTYNINENVRKVAGINGEEYYIWTNSNQDKINLLNSKTNIRPEVKSIRLASIRYYRIDLQRKMVVLKTDVEDIYFHLTAAEVFNEMIKMKKLENLVTFNPGDYINDFELYMHGMKSKILSEQEQIQSKINTLISKIVLMIVILGALIGVKIILSDYAMIIHLLTLVCIFIFNDSFRRLIHIKAVKTKNDNDYIKYFSSDRECLERFAELKYALGISDSFERVYTAEGACYLTWVANGYFHVFLNVIYFNVVYMAINLSDVLYYKVEERECLLKLKDKTLTFTVDAAKVFAKILPNKDYEWLKGYQNIGNV